MTAPAGPRRLPRQDTLMCWDVTRQLATDARAPERARRFCAEQLTGMLAERPERDGLLQNIYLIATELVTNAVNARASTTTLGLSWHRHRIRLTVDDDAPGAPTPQPPSSDQSHGRGLAIVELLSTAWGVRPDSQH